MVKFDTSALPSGLTISSAELMLYVKDIVEPAATNNIVVHQMMNEWGGSEVTWFNRTAEAWTAAGGDYDTTVLTNCQYSSLVKGAWVTFTLPTDVVQGWVNTPSSNYGFLIKPAANTDPSAGPEYIIQTNTAWLASSEDAAVDNRPKLILTYPTCQLTVTAGQHGSVSCLPDLVEFPSNAPVTLTATASNYYHFGSWSGDLTTEQGASNPVALVMSQDRSITANFVENQATNGTPQWWLAQYGWTNNFDSWALLDSDFDGMTNWQEAIAGTDPTLKSSALDMKQGAVAANGGINVVWQSVSGKTYQVMYAISLTNTWLSDLPGSQMTAGSGETNLVYTDTTVGPKTNRFYRVKIVTP